MAKKVSTKKAEETVETPVILRPDVDVAVEKRLIALYTLQSVDSEIDKIKIIRGELPQAVQDLEDEIAGLNTRIENFTAEIKETEAANKQRNVEISEHQEQIKKYQKQQDNVRNNREYESLNKEIEFQDLEIQLCERKMKEGTATSRSSNSTSRLPSCCARTARRTSTSSAKNCFPSPPKPRRTNSACWPSRKSRSSTSKVPTSATW